MGFSFFQSSLPEIHFGVGKMGLLPQRVKSLGNKVLIVTGGSSFLNSESAHKLFADLETLSVHFFVVKITGEPSPDDIDQTVKQYRSWKPDVVVAIGGGSAIDAGKAISAMLCESGSIVDLLEGVGTRKPTGMKIPFIAIPTTSGTGSEATYNAVITRQGPNGYKKSLRHPNFVPDIAIVDPALTVGCPPAITAASGLDAITQLLEAYLSTNSNPFTDALALDGLKQALTNIEKAVDDGSDIEARSAMSYAALLSGIALANAGLGVVHGFAQPLGSFFPIPHGVVCGNLIGTVNRLTVQKLYAANDVKTLQKYANVASILFHCLDQMENINRLIDHFDQMIDRFGLPRFSAFGVSSDDFPRILDDTGNKNHPVNLTRDELAHILTQRL
jgi:alcohol dehydrogenase class IV